MSPRMRELGGLAAFALVVACVHAVRPTASYRTLEIGGDAAAVGIVAASYAALSAIAAVPLGRSIDRFGPRRFFFGGVTLLAGGALLSATASRIAVLASAQALVGLGQVSAAISFQTSTAERAGTDTDRDFARLAVAASTGQLVGPVLAGAILGSGTASAGSFRTTAAFVAAAGLAVLSLVFARGISTPRPSGDPRDRATGPVRAPLMTIVRRSGMPQALIASIAVLTAIDLLIAYLPVIGDTRGIPPGVIGLILALRAAAGLASRLSITTLLRRLGRRRLLLASMAAAGLAMLGIAVPGPAGLVALMVLIVGYGLGVGSPMTMAWVASSAPGGGRGAALAVRMTGNRVGQVLVPAAVGALASLLGPPVVFVSAACGLLASSGWVRSSSLGEEP